MGSVRRLGVVMRVSTGASTSVLGPGPQLRVLGPAFTPNSNPPPSSITLTIPAETQTTDFIIVAVNNFVVPGAGSTATNWSTFSGQLGQGSFPCGITIMFKIAEVGDAGKTISWSTLAGSTPGSMAAMMYVFTNPNQSDIGLRFGSPIYISFRDEYQPFNFISTSNTSSLTVGQTHQGQLYPPSALRFSACTAYGTSSLTSMSYSGGSGIFRQINDSQFIHALGAVYEPDATNAQGVGTFIQSNVGAMSAMSMYLI